MHCFASQSKENLSQWKDTQKYRRHKGSFSPSGWSRVAKEILPVSNWIESLCFSGVMLLWIMLCLEVWVTISADSDCSDQRIKKKNTTKVRCYDVNNNPKYITAFLVNT